MRKSIRSLPVELARSAFDDVPSAAFFVKDGDYSYVAANAAMLRICGVLREQDVLGRRSQDFFSHANASRGEESERQTFAEGIPTLEKLSNVIAKDSRSHWLLIRRWPIRDESGAVIGIAGLGRIQSEPEKRHGVYQRLARAVEHMNAHFREPISIHDVGSMLNLSMDRLEREFSAVFGVSPREYVTRIRLDVAKQRLASDDSIAEISHSCGYSDQSAFTRRFKSLTGMTPTEYRDYVIRRAHQV